MGVVNVLVDIQKNNHSLKIFVYYVALCVHFGKNSLKLLKICKNIKKIKNY